jgi:hypothetical protein
MAPAFLELIVIVAILGSLVGVGLAVWAAIDAASKSDEAWRNAGQNKVVWIIVPVGTSLLCGLLGIVAVAIYAFNVRPKVAAHAHPR